MCLLRLIGLLLLLGGIWLSGFVLHLVWVDPTDIVTKLIGTALIVGGLRFAYDVVMCDEE